MAQPLDLPSLYTLMTLRESGDAFAHAQSLAARDGAGLLVWAGRHDVAEFAVVLEPEEPLAAARLAFYACMNALADALAVHAPPEKPLAFAWPGEVRLNQGLLGGGQLAWPEEDEGERPDWLVFGAMVRVSAPMDREPGEWTRGATLEEEGFAGVGAADIIESFSRHLMTAMNNWIELGPRSEVERWLERFPERRRAVIGPGGELIRPGEPPRDFAEALRAPGWLNADRGEPWL
ncbi:MAG: biotin/lipoate--protein ligase family protein [Hyphomicrobiales bacterium]|nr:biotin/lipoate--protein ligase family protein [Hyphomicrobiales bacterium]